MEHPITQSYCHGSTEIPLEFWRCFDRLQHWVERTPGKEIIVFREPNAPRQAISFAEFHRLTDGVAGRLIRDHPDLQAGANVLILGPNCLNYCVVATGLHKAGLVTVKLHPQDRQSLETWSRRTDTKAVFYHAEDPFQTGADWLQDSVRTRVDFEALIRAGREALVENSGSDGGSGDGLRELLRQRQSQFSADDNYSMYPTSGSTGKPKLVPHSHFAMVNSVRFRAICALLTSEDVFFSDRATAHVVGEFGLQSAMVMGLTLVTTPTSIFTSGRGAKNVAAWLLDMLAEERVTSGDFFGYLVHDILHRAGRPPPECLRSALVAGSLTTSQQMARAMAVLPGISNYYGTTETSMITAVCPPWGPTDDRQSRRDTVGRPAMHMEVLVTEPGSRAAFPLPTGASGEIWTRGFSVMRSYHDDPEKTREALTESGWYQTGDLGYIDANGRVTVTGRIKDLIIRASVNIIPSSIEDVLLAHPGVHAVVVLGVPDERLSEEIAACVVLRPERRDRREPERQTAQELARWCLDRGLAESRDGLSYAPRYWAFLDGLPASPTGKVIRSEVREHVTRGRGFIDGLEFVTSS